jgi:hypothetical protein
MLHGPTLLSRFAYLEGRFRVSENQLELWEYGRDQEKRWR